MAYTTIDDPGSNVSALVYAGNNAANRTLTGVGFDPDLFWIKQRNSTQGHLLMDTVKGNDIYQPMVQNIDNPNTGIAELSDIGTIRSTADGFLLGAANESAHNGNGSNYISWCWEADTAFSNDASATSVGSIDSAGRVNTDAGFSIIGWTGNGGNATIAHGLGAVPKMIWFKSRSAAENFNVYHVNTGNTHYTELNTSIAATDHARFQDTTPTSTVFSVSGTNAVNHENNPMIAYCWAEIPGYSKIGTYEGQNVLDNVFIHLGFRPEIVFFKNVDDATAWKIFDAGRDPFNDGTGTILSGNENNAEDDNTAYNMNFVSNGIKMRGQNNNINKVNTYIYAAWAKNPFVNSKGIPANAV